MTRCYVSQLFVVATLVAAIPTLVWGQSGPCVSPELVELVPPSGEVDSGYGAAVDTDALRAIVGSPDGYGSAHIFVRDMNGTPDFAGDDTWHEEAVLAPFVGYDSVGFGRAVAIRGAWAFVSSQTDNGVGEIFVYRLDDIGTPSAGDDVWVEHQALIGSDTRPGDRFGDAMAISEGHLLVGASDHAVDGKATGAAYVFQLDSGVAADDTYDDEWVEVAKLLAPAGRANDGFGADVAIDDFAQLIVAAPGADVVNPADANCNSGAAYVFRPVGDQSGHARWQLESSLQPHDAQCRASGHHFAGSVAIYGDLVVVGAAEDKNVNGQAAGAAYVFARNPFAGESPWSQQAKLVAPNGVAFERFGAGVAIGEDRVIVNANSGDFALPGRTMVFEPNDNVISAGSAWDPVLEALTPSTMFTGSVRSAISVRGNTLVVGIVGDDGRVPGDVFVSNLEGDSGGLEDSDDDGFIDVCDACPESDFSQIVTVGRCRTGVANRLAYRGCTLTDIFDRCLRGVEVNGIGMIVDRCAATEIKRWQIMKIVDETEALALRRCLATTLAKPRKASGDRRP